MRKLILKNLQSPGDVLMLTAALKSLHLIYPKQFMTDVRTSCDELFDNNPFITPLSDHDPEATIIPLEYPVIHQSNNRPTHFLTGFMEDLNEKLGLHLYPISFKGDVYLSPEEKQAPSEIEYLVEERIPYWLVVAGGKLDYTIKWWRADRYQKVVDHFARKLVFVQVGDRNHNHFRLKNVLDMVGETTVRKLMQLVYFSQGVLCPVTFAMHLSAAVELRPRRDDYGTRPCVVIGGGREPAHWEAYPGHQFLHTIGALPCCQSGGCWRSRTRPLNDGSDHDFPGRICINVVNDLPKCMDLITAEAVIERIELYFNGGAFDHS